MRRLWLIGALAILVSLSACTKLAVITIFAQALPVTKTVAWDPNAATDQVTNYTVMLDAIVIGNPTGTSQSVTFTTAGAHTLAVTATNVWGTSAPTSLAVNVVVPAAPQKVRIQ